MAAKFDIDLNDALRQLSEFQLRSSNLGRHLDSLNTGMKDTGSAASRLMKGMDGYYSKLQESLTNVSAAAKKDAEAIDAAFAKIRGTAAKTFESIATANVKANMSASAYAGELKEVQKLLVNTASNNIYVKYMEKISTLQHSLTGQNSLLRASIEALSTAEGKRNVELKGQLASESRIAGAAGKQTAAYREQQQQLSLLSTEMGRASSVLAARSSAIVREQQEQTRLTAKLGESRRAQDSLNGGIQAQIATQNALNTGLQQAATFREREQNQVNELRRRHESLNGGLAEQSANLKVLNSAREKEITEIAREGAAIDDAKRKLAGLTGGRQEEITRINAQIAARREQIKGEEKYSASLSQLTNAEARAMAQDQARAQTMQAKNAATLAQAKSQQSLSVEDARNIALAEKLNQVTAARNNATLEAARSVHGLSTAQRELAAVEEKEATTLAKLRAQRDGLNSTYGRNLAAIRAQIVEQERLNKLSTMSTSQLLGLTGAHTKHTAAMNIGSQSAASLRAALGGLQTNIGMYTSGTIVAASSTYALFSAMRSTVTMGAEFTASMAKANAVMNANNPTWMPDSMKAMETQVRALGQSTIFTASEVAEGLIDLGQAGLSATDAILALRPALDLAQIGNLSMSQSADIATNVMMIFGKSAADLTNIVDVMATAAVDSNTNVLELANALTYAGPAAHAAGISMEETTAAIETLANAGIKGSRSGTALRKLFTSLLNPTKKGAAVLDEYSIATQNADGSTRKLVDIIKDLNQALNAEGVTDGKRLASIQNLVGLYATSPVAALVNNAKTLEAALYTLEHNVTGAAERMRQKMSDTLKVDWKETLSAYEELQLQVYDKFEARLRLMSAQVTKTLLDLTTPVKVMLNSSGAEQSLDQLVDKANASGKNNIGIQTKQDGTRSAVDRNSGAELSTQQLVESMDKLAQSQLTVITGLDELIEKFKTFGETAVYVVGGLVSAKVLGAARTAFTNLSTDIGKLNPRLLEIANRANTTANTMGMMAVVTAKNSTSMGAMYTASALGAKGFAYLTTATTLATRALNGLAIAGSFITGVLGWAAAIGTIGYAIYNAFSKDNDQAIIAQASSIDALKERYNELNASIDQFGAAKEKQALQQQVKNEEDIVNAIKARLVVLRETEATYQRIGKEVPKPVSYEITLNESRLAKTEEQIVAFNSRISNIGATTVEVKNAADRANEFSQQIMAQEKKVNDARLAAEADFSDTAVIKFGVYEKEKAALEALKNQIDQQAQALNNVANSAITVQAAMEGIAQAGREAADKELMKEGTWAEKFDQSAKEMAEAWNTLKQMEKDGAGQDLLERQGKRFVEAQRANAKALANTNEEHAKLEDARIKLSTAGIAPDESIATLSANTQRLQEVLSNIAKQREEGSISQQMADQQELKATEDLIAAKNKQYTTQKALDSAAKAASRKTPEQKLEDQLEVYIGKQNNARDAALSAAAAYSTGTDAIREYAIKQEIANQGLKYGAEAYDRLKEAVTGAQEAKEKEEIQKSIYSIKEETAQVDLQTAATYKGEEALRQYNIQKEYTALLAGKNREVNAQELKDLKAATEARAEAAKQLAKAGRGMSLVDDYDKAGVLAREYAKDVEALNSVISQGGPTADKASEALYRLNQTYEGNQRALTAWGKLTDDALERVNASFADAWKNIGSGFDGFSKSLLNGFRQMLAEMAHEAITKPIMISFANQIMGTNRAGGISETIDRMTGGTGAGGGMDVGSVLSSARSAWSVGTSDFGKTVAAGWNSGDGFFGGVKNAGSNGYDYVSGLFSKGAGSSAGATAGSSIADYSGPQFNNFIANQGNSFGGNLMSAGPAFAGIMGAYNGWKQNGFKGAAAQGLGAWGGGALGMTAGIAASGAISGTAMGAAFGTVLPGLGTAIGAALGAAFGSKLFAGQWETKDYGMQFGVTNGKLDANEFEYQKKSGGLFGKNKKRTKLGEMGAEQVASLNGIYKATADATKDLFKDLNIKMEEGILDGLNVGITQVSTKNKTQEQIQLEVQKFFGGVADAMVTAINTATSSGLDDYDFEGLYALVNNLKGVNALLTNLNVGMYDMNVGGAKLAEKMTEMAGGFENLAGQLGSYYDNYFSESEKADDLLEAVNKQFKDMNYNLPATRKEYRDFIETLDKSTDEGMQAFLTLTKASASAAQAYTIMEQRAAAAREAGLDAGKTWSQLAIDMANGLREIRMSNVNAAFTALQRAVDADRKRATEAFNALSTSLNDMISTANESVSSLTAMSGALEQALKTIRGTAKDAAAMQYAEAQNTLTGALNVARKGGDISKLEGLTDALSALAANNTDSYSSYEEFLFAQGTTANKIEELGKINGTQLTTAEKTLRTVQDQLAAAQKAYDDENTRFDKIMEDAQAQLDALNGVDTSVKTVKDAVEAMNLAVTTAIMSIKGSPASNTNANNLELVRTAYESILGRKADDAGLAAWAAALQAGSLTYGQLPGQLAGAAANGGGKDAAKGNAYLNNTIDEIYKSVLGRGADAGGSAFWAAQMANGSMTPDQIAAAIAASEEGKGKKYAVGGAFTNTVVRTPTSFDESLMGEAGPEGILPLANVGGVLGVHAVGGGRGAGSEVELLRSELAEMRNTLRSIAKWTARTASNTDYLSRWDANGLPEVMH